MTVPTPDLGRLFAPVKRIDEYLARVLDEPGHWIAPALAEAMKYAVLGGGKRLRPLLTWYCCEALGAPGEESLAAGAAVEFVHAFSLVHDDLPALDNDEVRRGKPTLHRHAGETMAVLAGDALLNFAYLHLAHEAPGFGDTSTFYLSGAVQEMISGQVYDTVGGFEPGQTAEQRLNRIHRAKTGALIEASCLLGLASAHGWWTKAQSTRGKDPSLRLKETIKYGQSIGLMFQIVDDLLDVEQPADAAGKRTGKDAAAGKLTYPGVFGVEKSKAEVARLKAEALKSIKGLGPPAEPLRELCEYLAGRTW